MQNNAIRSASVAVQGNTAITAVSIACNTLTVGSLAGAAGVAKQSNAGAAILSETVDASTMFSRFGDSTAPRAESVSVHVLPPSSDLRANVVNSRVRAIDNHFGRLIAKDRSLGMKNGPSTREQSDPVSRVENVEVKHAFKISGERITHPATLKSVFQDYQESDDRSQIEFDVSLANHSRRHARQWEVAIDGIFANSLKTLAGG
jgi:hypothetical protein